MIAGLWLTTALLTLAPAERPDLWVDGERPLIVGRWSLYCGRDGNLGGLSFEACGATLKLGETKLSLARSPREVDVSVWWRNSCVTTVVIPVRRLRAGARDRVAVLRRAFEKALDELPAKCPQAGPLGRPALNDRQLERILYGSDGLMDFGDPPGR
jgi:hypothetical protein